MARELRRRAARRRDRRRLGRAPADLGRARLQRRAPTPTATCSSAPARTSARATATSSPCATSSAPTGRASSRARAFRSTATASSPPRPTVEARRGAHGGPVRARSGRRGSRAASSTSPGTSPSAAPQRIARAAAGDPRRRLRRARRHEPRRPHRPGRRARVRPRRLPRRDDHAPDAAILRVCGTFTVPCFLDQPLCPTGSRFAFADARSNDPVRIPGNTMLANYDCIMPTASGRNPRARALRPRPARRRRPRSTSAPARDGQAARLRLLRDRLEGHGRRRTSRTSATILNDLSRFPTLTDRLQQGLLNFLYLGRLMIHPDGFSSRRRLRWARSTRAELFYDGNSQGGIFGGTLTAVAPDFQRAVLGVPGDELLDAAAALRPTSPSTARVLYASYPNELERPLLFSLIQQLWDRSDPNGYAQHMTTDPLPEHAAAHRADADRGRRPPGRQRRRRRRGAHDRRADPREPRRRRPHATTCAPFFAIDAHRLPDRRLGLRALGRGRGRHAARPERQHAAGRAGADPHGDPRSTAGAPRTRRPSTCGPAARSPTTAPAVPATRELSHSGLK